MFKPKRSIVLLAFLLISFFQLFLYKQVVGCTMDKHIIWISTNILYLASISSIFTRYWSSGVLEQLSTSNIHIRRFISRTIVDFWISIGLPLILFATILYCLLSYYSIHLRDLLFFSGSLIYSTITFSFIGALCNCFTVTTDRITYLIIAAPISIPGIVMSMFILNGSLENLGIFIFILVGNILIVSIFPVIIEIVLREVLENL